MDADVRIGVALAVVALASCSRTRSGELPPSHADKTDAAPAAPAPAPSALASAAPAPAPEPEEPRCEGTGGVTLFVSPERPFRGAPVRVLATSDRPLSAELRVEVEGGTAGAPLAASETRRGGPPYFWVAEVKAPPAGQLVATLSQRACEPGVGQVERRVAIARGAPSAPPLPKDKVWPARGSWTRAHENVYSAWIEALFDAPDGEQPSWSALHEVLRDPKRNLLFDHLGAGEDSTSAPVVRPDCADLPYFLRAYFAFKVRLPFGLAECTRGGGGAPPSCKGLITNEDPPARERKTAVDQFGAFLRGTLADKAHSGSARTPLDDPSSDYYAVPITWESLRPGTIFADPYGHVLMVAKKLPQNGERGGVLLAVDGQPDGTVARKRFWRGNFLYAVDRELGGPGFKRFRPVARRGGQLARLSDEEIARSPDYGDVSLEAAKLDVEGFYDRMDDVLSPRPLDPARALMEKIEALDEQVQTRVKSVDNGRRWLERASAPADMPEGAEIFETTGPWEDFSTPSRDLRLLIAIDVVRGFPALVARRPERYAMPTGKTPRDVEAELSTLLDRELRARQVTYTRTDGSPFTLTLAEVLGRSQALEMAFNPNDCVEVRWGAPPGSDEASTCRGRAPAEQRARMETYRPWLRDRRRPPRK